MPTVFLAGATGAIGRSLVPMLIGAGYTVHGYTRSADKAADLERTGMRAHVGDVYDTSTLTAAVVASAPEIVIHQLTDLPQSLEGGLSAEALARNARVRIEGTKNLVDAALKAGARSFVAQSIMMAYAAGPEPHVESDPLDAETRGSVITLERLALESPPLAGCVLRFGNLYGPGTWYPEASGTCPVHVDAAASATLLAIQKSATGVFNVAEDRGYASSARARTELGWNDAHRAPH